MKIIQLRALPLALLCAALGAPAAAVALTAPVYKACGPTT
jgi:hypothetical protein